MGKVRALLACSECGQPCAQWAGRCPSCGAWGTIAERPRPGSPGSGAVSIETLASTESFDRRVTTGFAGVDRVLGGGLVPASVVLLAGEPGIGKSTLLLQLLANVSAAGLTCLLASGEESRQQIAARARRLGIDGGGMSFVPGRDLEEILQAAAAQRPSVLALDSIQTVRLSDAPSAPGGPAQVRTCADALVGLAKSQDVTVLMTGHVTKEGDVAGPRALEHTVDQVLSFEGDPRSGLRLVVGGKNRFGPEGEVAWFEMGPAGLAEVDPPSHRGEAHPQPGAATALALTGRRALPVEIQALAIPTEGPPRRHVTGIDSRRFSLLAAVVDRAAGIPLVRSELYGASGGGLRVDDPGVDLAIAAALASSARGSAPPSGSAFVGEVSLTGRIRPAPGFSQRLAAAEAAGVRMLFAPGESGRERSIDLIPVRHARDALAWA